MLYIHCEAPSEGAVLLAEHLRDAGIPSRRSRDVEWLHKKIKGDDVIIGWGAFIPFAGVKILNGKPLSSKWEELEVLENAGVPVPPHDRKNWGDGWLPRSLHHQEGSDFLPGNRPVGFYTKRLNIIEEYRFHIFKFKEGSFVSLRAGKKIPKVGEDAHPWIRSWSHGWYISYGKYDIPAKARNVAKKALEAVGYDFGAVDVGLLKGGKEVVVLEVNSRPGLEVGGQTVLRYVEGIKKTLGIGYEA